MAAPWSGMIPEAIARTLRPGRILGCLVIVHSDVDILAQRAEHAIQMTQGIRLSIGEPLARELLVTAPRFRLQRAQRWVNDRVEALAPAVVACTEIDLLFAPDLDPDHALGLDPLTLIRAVGRTTPLIVAWPGSFVGDVLTYAAPEHAHYRAWRNPNVQIWHP